MNKKYLLQILKETNPHYFGLGFIQCKINKYERIHIYHPDLMPIVNIEEEVHNHRYDFESTILLGSITNKKYEFIEGSKQTHFLQNESCNETIKVENNQNKYGTINLISEDTVNVGESYFMRYDEFHTFQTTQCITYLKRSDYKQDLAQVIRPLNNEIICPFSKKLKEEECWEIINKTLKDMK